MDLYSFKGAVMDQFGKCIDPNYTAATRAPSVEKARSNLLHTWRMSNGKEPWFKIKLEGKLEQVSGKESK